VARPKSFLQRISLDHAKRKTKCRFNPKSHIINKGEARLKLSLGQESPRYYCVACAERFLARDLDSLSSLLEEIRAA